MAKHKRPLDIWTSYEGHGGIDYPYASWTPIPATGNGYVSARGSNSRGGNFVYVIYDDGQVEGFFHLVSHDGPGEGSRVSEGTIVGYVGSTGNSTGPHLHHEVENPQGNLREPNDYWNYVDQSDNGFVGGGAVGGFPSFPLPWGYYFGWSDGPVESVSGYYSHSNDLRTWQQRMLDRGWDIIVDGLYGPNTNQVAVDFQAEKGLVVDGKIGPATWDAAWTAPIT